MLSSPRVNGTSGEDCELVTDGRRLHLLGEIEPQRMIRLGVDFQGRHCETAVRDGDCLVIRDPDSPQVFLLITPMVMD